MQWMSLLIEKKWQVTIKPAKTWLSRPKMLLCLPNGPLQAIQGRLILCDWRLIWWKSTVYSMLLMPACLLHMKCAHVFHHITSLHWQSSCSSRPLSPHQLAQQSSEWRQWQQQKNSHLLIKMDGYLTIRVPSTGGAYRVGWILFKIR